MFINTQTYFVEVVSPPQAVQNTVYYVQDVVLRAVNVVSKSSAHCGVTSPKLPKRTEEKQPIREKQATKLLV